MNAVKTDIIVVFIFGRLNGKGIMKSKSAMGLA